MYKPASKHTDHTYSYADDYHPDNALVHCVRRDDGTPFHVADDPETGAMHITAPDNAKANDQDSIGVRLAVFRKLGATRIIDRHVEIDDDGDASLHMVLVQHGGKGFEVTRRGEYSYRVVEVSSNSAYTVRRTGTGKWQLTGDNSTNVKPMRRDVFRTVAQCAAGVEGF